ncbi:MULTISPECIES: hypothetical protein [Pseudomonas]|uniref:Chemotaxis protein n=1 Tax=Pseudomonas farsensis TaxID=2745492 RepID=A0ABU8QTU2_9PSED|nr:MULTISPECIES: hypothetical protein [Pseudomonas]MBC3411050.1 hypothetical protein [Pseudomonas sp. SWRI51]MBV4531129.1 hypothetical protein [Pseudomonas farsensis]
MPATPRMQGLQDDLLRTAADLDTLSEALDGHARYLRHSIHKDDAPALDDHAQGLRDSAGDMRDLAATINS